MTPTGPAPANPWGPPPQMGGRARVVSPTPIVAKRPVIAPNAAAVDPWAVKP